MSKKIYIGVGHNNEDYGACANGLRESECTLKQANYLAAELKRCGFEVRQSRTAQTGKHAAEYIAEANSWGADAFVELHFNAGGGKGFEVYRSVVGGVSLTLANNIFDAVKTAGLCAMRSVKTKIGDGGRDYFQVIRETTMPAVLCEGAFIDNSADAKCMADAEWLKAEAAAYAMGICETFGVAYVAEQSAVPKTAPKTIEVGRDDSGALVELLQLYLADNGYAIYPDGIFGDKTEKFVRDFQKASGIYPDGICGKKTWPKLMRV